jgi:TPR repeat protein
VADPPNVTAAVNYFERAAELGNHDAAFNLGIIHYNGQTGVPNKAKAVKYWRKAARYGNAGASYQLALLSETCSEALEYSVAVAEQHSDIGLVLKKGVSSYLNNSMLKAIFHYIQAAEAGKEVAAFNVAWLSETCQDLQATIGAQLSKRYYSQSALLNYTPAIIRVGDSYWFGEWTEINKEFAMASYSQAAHLYNGQGLFNLGYIIQEGKLPVKREWVDFQVLSLGPRIQGNLTLASQLYDL